jgi:predicted metalloendopeptidase
MKYPMDSVCIFRFLPHLIDQSFIGIVYLDNQGIQWDATGVLKDWMDKKSDEGFQQMAKCVIDEYDKFDVEGHHINGTMTLGENIADNGG